MSCGGVLGDGIELRMSLDPDLDRVNVDPEQIAAGDPQPDLQCPRRHAAGRPGDSRDPHDRGASGQPHPSAALHAGPLRAAQGDRHRPGDGRRRCGGASSSRSSAPRQGTEIAGLGLSTAYGIVTQSGGQIVADSEPGNGIALPHLPAQRRESRAGEAGEDGTPASEHWETILLVEDEENVRRPLAEILKGARLQRAGGRRRRPGDRDQPPATRADPPDGDRHPDGRHERRRARRALSYDRAGMKVLFATGYPAGLAEEGSSLTRADTPLLKKPFSGRDLAAEGPRGAGRR